MRRFEKRAIEIPLYFRFQLSKMLLTSRRRKKSGMIVGLIKHEGGTSEVWIHNFQNPLVTPPSVDCRESWIRRSVSWHYETHRSRFCWVLEEEWRQHFQERIASGESSEILCQDAAVWLSEAIAIVLYRHWVGHKTGMFKWPDVWQDYSHGDAGVKEFQSGTYRKVETLNV